MSHWNNEAWEPLSEPLTRREREILALLAQGQTAPEIAEQLTLAVSSVKWHIQQLYGKLGVNSKRQAITRAQALGLLDTSWHPGEPTAVPQPARPLGVPIAVLPQTIFAGSPHPTGGQAADPGSFHNLPLPVTRFFGREREIALVRERLAQDRLVTLTGLGGVGKTRLALQAAQAILGDYPNGAWFVELAALIDPTLVPQQVAASLGLHDEPGQPIVETLTAFLRSRHLLLVLDNCEHLLEACARLADNLLRVCPRLRLLACSREPLGVAGEAVFPVPSLPFPEPGHVLAPERMAEYASVRLFADRARLVRPAYEVAPHNASAVAHICQRVDGIPLAIEMAAARVNILTAEQLAARLDDAFSLLTGGSRTALPRQQTLRATIDWSYKLLSDTERRLLQRLAVFAGGCTLQAAEAVGCDDEERPTNEAGEGHPLAFRLPPAEVLDRLAALVDKSMVVAVHRAGQDTRYYLLEMVRQYAREKLEAAGESARTATRHRDYFLKLAETDRSQLEAAERLIACRRLEAETENLRQALEWSFNDLSDIEAGPRLVLATGGLQASHREALDWHKRAVALCQRHPEIGAHLHARLLGCGAGLTALDDPPTALTWAQQAVAISRGLGPGGQETLMDSLMSLGWTYMTDLSDPEHALAPYAEAEAILHALGRDQYTPKRYQETMACLAAIKAELALKQGLYQAAKMHAFESIRLYAAMGDANAWCAWITVGSACLGLGENDQARVHFLEALHIIDENNDIWHKPYIRRCLALAELRLGNLDRALVYCQESLRQAAVLPDNNIVASGLGLSACIWAQRGQAERAARLSGAAQSLYARQKRKPWEDSSLDTLLPGWRDGLDQAVIEQAFEMGRAMNAEQAVAYALGGASL